MIIIICSECYRRLWDNLSQQEIADRSQEAIDILCSDCLLKLAKSYYILVDDNSRAVNKDIIL